MIFIFIPRIINKLKPQQLAENLATIQPFMVTMKNNFKIVLLNSLLNTHRLGKEEMFSNSSSLFYHRIAIDNQEKINAGETVRVRPFNLL